MLKNYKNGAVSFLALLLPFLLTAQPLLLKKAHEQNSDPVIITPMSGTNDVDVIKKWQMPDILKEISGISYISSNRFACIQDNKGSIFIYNTSGDSLEKIIPFWDSGDFEGIALAGNTIYAVRSNGILYAVTNYKRKNPTIKEYRTSLTEKQNVEGLCYDEKNKRLLLAIKSNELNTKDYKGIYAFDLVKKVFVDEPVIKIDLNDPVWKNTSDEQKIRPSDLAVHPVTGDIYVIDGEEPKLIILSPTGAIRSLQQLKRTQFRLPEGICFSKKGDLFICNEGGLLEKGNILKVALE